LDGHYVCIIVAAVHRGLLLSAEVHASVQIVYLSSANKAFCLDFFVTTEFGTGHLYSVHKEIEVPVFHASGAFTDNIDGLTESIGVMPYRMVHVVAGAITWPVHRIVILVS